MNANTVILFPIERVAVRDNIESLGGNRQKILDTRMNIINQMVDYHASRLVAELSREGVDVDASGFDKDFALAIECLRAGIYKTCELEHPLRKAMDDMIGQIESYDDDPDPNIA